MLVFDVNDTKVKCPSCWEEAKLKHFQFIMRDCVEGDSPVKVFSALTGTQYTDIDQSTSEDLEAGIYQATAFVFNQEQTFRKVAMPSSIELRGKQITIPREVQRLTVGQNFQMRKELAGSKNLESILSIACAIYLQPLVDESKFDFGRAKELEAEILEMDLFTIFPIGFFLLNRLNNSGRSGISSLLQNLRTMIRRTQTWRLQHELMSLSLCMSLALLTGTPKPTDNFQESCNTNPSMSSSPSFFCGNDKANFNTDFTYFKS